MDSTTTRGWCSQHHKTITGLSLRMRSNLAVIISNKKLSDPKPIPMPMMRKALVKSTSLIPAWRVDALGFFAEHRWAQMGTSSLIQTWESPVSHRRIALNSLPCIYVVSTNTDQIMLLKFQFALKQPYPKFIADVYLDPFWRKGHKNAFGISLWIVNWKRHSPSFFNWFTINKMLNVLN